MKTSYRNRFTIFLRYGINIYTGKRLRGLPVVEKINYFIRLRLAKILILAILLILSATKAGISTL